MKLWSFTRLANPWWLLAISFSSMAAQLSGSGGCFNSSVFYFSRPTNARRRVNTFSTLSQSRSDAQNWVEATSSFFEQDKRPIMLFDGVCNLCNGGVKFIRDNDRKKTIRYEPLQSEGGKMLLRRSGRAPDDISSFVLVEEDRFIRDFVYDNVANNRYLIFGRSESCAI